MRAAKRDNFVQNKQISSCCCWWAGWIRKSNHADWFEQIKFSIQNEQMFCSIMGLMMFAPVCIPVTAYASCKHCGRGYRWLCVYVYVDVNVERMGFGWKQTVFFFHLPLHKFSHAWRMFRSSNIAFCFGCREKKAVMYIFFFIMKSLKLSWKQPM